MPLAVTVSTLLGAKVRDFGKIKLDPVTFYPYSMRQNLTHTNYLTYIMEMGNGSKFKTSHFDDINLYILLSYEVVSQLIV